MTFGNHFLDSLSLRDVAALRPHLTEVELARNTRLGEPGEPVVDIHLPIDAVLSVVTVMRDGAQVESRTIGRESGYGLLHALGSPIAYERMLIQVGGRSWRLPAERVREAVQSSPGLAAAIVQHAQATLLQTAHAAACNSLHSAERRLCRWLLMTQDRVGSDVLPLTQEHLSIMLGVQRTTVTVLASGLQARGMISYARGRITVRNRPGLEAAACECYAAVRTATETVLRWR
ncbi:Crp/Fnr family transcriptional regulator [Phenylobacterium sp.]|jgi:CRP-like cAMP-binding protein|uniref:Crp/Fnr family transcriptional regulator n=1 Tax=Phenylobacterium sp. TaxID=1871053 RepID=UPI003783FD63